MKNTISNKKMIFLNAAIIGVLLLTSIILIFIPKVSANIIDTDLELVNSTTEESQVITLNNVKNYADSQTKTSFFRSANGKSKTNVAKELYAKLGFDEEEISEMDNEKLNSILEVESATVKQMYIATTEEGESYSIPASAMSRAANQVNYLFPDIANDNGTTGYMAGRIEIYQDADYDKYDTTKDPDTKETSITKFYAYGFRAECSMWWIKEPYYKLDDAFVLNWDGNAYTEASYSENKMELGYKSLWEQNGGTAELPIVWQENLKPSAIFQFGPNDGQSVYTDLKITYKLKIRANNGFMINMGYAHKQVFGSGNIGYKLGSGASIDFKLTTGARKYISGPLRVECITNPEREALR